MKPFLPAIAVLVSTIVGVGMFGLPYVGAQSGFGIAAVILVFLTVIIATVHLLYGEIVCRTEGKHRLVGYADKYLGHWGKKIVSISVVVGFYSSLLVYIIVGGDFIGVMFSSIINIPPVLFNLAFFIVGAIALYGGIRLVAKIDLLMGALLIVIVLLFFYLGFSQIKTDNLKVVNWNSFFLPYGATLYSLAGLSAIPEIKDFFKKGENRKYKKSIFWGTLIPAILYFLFMITVIGLMGAGTTEESISGLAGILGKKVIWVGAFFGFLATITSFFSIGISLKETFICDYKINKNLAWFLVCFVPLILLSLGVHNFITIIILTGALLGAIEGSAVVLIHGKAKKLGSQITDYNLKIPSIFSYAIILVFIIGFILTLVFTL
jgi:tyrosine-specific transport protein